MLTQLSLHTFSWNDDSHQLYCDKCSGISNDCRGHKFEEWYSGYLPTQRRYVKLLMYKVIFMAHTSLGYTTITSYSSMNPTATPSTITTLVTASGNTQGTVEYIYPSSTGYTTVTFHWTSTTTSSTIKSTPTNNIPGEVDLYVPGCGSINPGVNFKLTLNASSYGGAQNANDSFDQVGISSGSPYDGTQVNKTLTKGTGTNNATFYLDNNCELWTNTGATTSYEQGFVNVTNTAADPQFYFSAKVPTTGYAVPTCFVDANGYLNCFRPPPAGSTTTSSYTVNYACPQYWRLGASIPSSNANCFQIYLQTQLTGTNTTLTQGSTSS